MAIHLGTSVQDLPGIGISAAKDLQRLGISSVRDLLWHVPFRYDDFSHTKPIPLLRHGDVVTLTGIIKEIGTHLSRNGRVKLTEAIFENETGVLRVTWFNQPYLEKTVPAGTRLSLAGRVDRRFGSATLVNPVREVSGKGLQTGRLVPVYGLAGSLTQFKMRQAISSSLPALREVTEWLPDEILASENLPTLSHTLALMHTPDRMTETEDGLRRLAFEELFLHQLLFAQVKRQRSTCSACSIPTDVEALRAFVAALPFTLTKGQRVAAWEIVQDLAKEVPMNRLLQGDVGSGKTVVALLAARAVLAAGHRFAYLAPTALLAEQHYRTCRLLIPHVSCALLTSAHAMLDGEEMDRKKFFECVRAGEISSLVGTHALLQEGVELPELSFLVIDEQHRFGVEQRHALLKIVDRPVPHLLSMTATPIPRSLALTFYGDLEVSTLRERPTGRLPVRTEFIGPGQEQIVWKTVQEEVESGNQAFVICPLIDFSDTFDTASVLETAKRLRQGPFKGLRVSVLHGQMPSAEKESVLFDFAKGKADVLVSTTVVEVGIDVSNATVMVVLGADRFGLAQLHQLRGRVGRSDKPSVCFLCPSSLGQGARERLEAVVQCQDGFVLAEKDLELRGAGNLLGLNQSGFADFRFATLADVDLMKKARNWAEKILSKDPELLAYPFLRERTRRALEEVHLE